MASDEQEEVTISDDFRCIWESDEHWELRKLFLAKHWGSVDEARLICLSQVFINVELLGCIYNERVMDEVQPLAVGLADEYHSRREQVVRKTFAKVDRPEATRRTGSMAAAKKMKRGR